MGRESKVKSDIVKNEVVTERTEIEYELEDKEIEGTRCDFCDQWYSDNEGVEFTEMYGNPSVKGLPDRTMTLDELLEYVYAAEVSDKSMGEDFLGNEFAADIRTIEIPPKRGIWMAIKQTIKDGGGLSRLDLNTFEASSNKEFRPEELDVGDILFTVDMDPRIEGDKQYMCEYCKEANQ